MNDIEAIDLNIKKIFFHFLNELDLLFPPYEKNYNFNHIAGTDRLTIAENKNFIQSLKNVIFIYHCLKHKKLINFPLTTILEEKNTFLEIRRFVKVLDQLISAQSDIKTLEIACHQFSQISPVPAAAELSHRATALINRVRGTMIDKKGNILESFQNSNEKMGKLYRALASYKKQVNHENIQLDIETVKEINNDLLPKLKSKEISWKLLPLSEQEIELALKSELIFNQSWRNLTAETIQGCSLYLNFSQKAKSCGKNPGKVAENALLVLLGTIFEHYLHENPVIHKDPYSEKFSGNFLKFVISCLDKTNIKISPSNIGSRWNRMEKSEYVLSNHKALGTKAAIAKMIFEMPILEEHDYKLVSQ